jgi:hypothetical protein
VRKHNWHKLALGLKRHAPNSKWLNASRLSQARAAEAAAGNPGATSLSFRTAPAAKCVAWKPKPVKRSESQAGGQGEEEASAHPPADRAKAGLPIWGHEVRAPVVLPVQEDPAGLVAVLLEQEEGEARGASVVAGPVAALEVLRLRVRWVRVKSNSGSKRSNAASMRCSG